MRHLPLLFGSAVLALLLWGACHTPPSQAKWEADTLRVFQGVQAREDSAAQRLREADSLKALAESLTLTARLTFRRGETSYRAALNLRDSLAGLTPPDTCLPYLLLASRSLDSLNVAYQSVREAFDSLRASQEPLRRSNTALLWAYNLQRENVDSLSALVRRAPVGGCRLLGVVPCPVPVVGYGLTLSGGAVYHGIQIGVAIPLRR